jgi:hypothetical protein
MTQSYMRGMGVARTLEGFFAGADQALHGSAGLGEQIAALVSSVARPRAEDGNGATRDKA